jgi:peptidoglycan-associated lipoprotein
LGLGQRRAEAAKNYLISLGIPADRMETTSWGKERPFCSEHDESCWQQNRRAHFVLAH